MKHEKTNTAVRVTSAPTDEISTLVQMVACIDCNNGRKLLSECPTITDQGQNFHFGVHRIP